MVGLGKDCGVVRSGCVGSGEEYGYVGQGAAWSGTVGPGKVRIVVW